jgi:hypothetical protein
MGTVVACALVQLEALRFGTNPRCDYCADSLGAELKRCRNGIDRGSDGQGAQSCLG